MAAKTLSQLVGGVIRSVQRGQQIVGGGTTTVNVTITAVDRDKSFLVTSMWTVDLNTDGLIGSGLTSDTNIIMTKGSGTNLAQVYWEVIEYE